MFDRDDVRPAARLRRVARDFLGRNYEPATKLMRRSLHVGPTHTPFFAFQH